MNAKTNTLKKDLFNPDKTRELQKDWQGYGKMSACYGLVVLFFVVLQFFLT